MMKYNIKLEYFGLKFGNESEHKSYQREFEIDKVTCDLNILTEKELSIIENSRKIYLNENCYNVDNIYMNVDENGKKSFIIKVQNALDNSDQLPF